MKVTTVISTPKEKEIIFPCLMELMSSDNHFIILATGIDPEGGYKGIAIKHHDEKKLTRIEGNWSKKFNPMTNQVILENE